MAIKVVILCGGEGTRLREETEYRPKPLVDIGGYPILWHIMKIYAHYGFKDFVLCLGYRGNMIKEYFLNYEAMTNDFTISLGSKNIITPHSTHDEQDFNITLTDTGSKSMTGGRIKRAGQYIDDDLFMATYGDGVSDVDVSKILDFHRSHGKLATATVVRPGSRFGIVDINDTGHVTNFKEKPQLDGWINAGFFVFNRKVLNYLEGDSCILEQEPMEQLAKEGELMAYKHPGSFMTMDTYREYLQLNALWNNNTAPWKIW